jgi:uncharacterized protein YprB with RNaseH-like and TPR domain
MAKGDDYLRRIEALNQQPLRNRPERKSDVEGVRRKLRKQAAPRRPAETAPPVVRQKLPPPAPARPRRPAFGAPVALAEAVPGSAVPSPGGGQALLVARSAAGILAEAAGIGAALHQALASDTSLRRRLCALAESPGLFPHDLLFLDIETCGLASAPLFLIGTMECRNGQLLVRQHFARDYSEEPAVISLFLQEASGKQMLVSFNGVTFDLRYIRERAAANGVRYRVPQPHFDLLPESRRVWGRRLPDCRLQTLEALICGRLRDSDIPGDQIPDAYHEFVRTGNAAEMAEVIHHNLLDLVTMADLLVRLGQ